MILVKRKAGSVPPGLLVLFVLFVLFIELCSFLRIRRDFRVD